MPAAPRRPRYFAGQLLTAEVLEAEQSYLLRGRRSDNRLLHGWGVVCGLGVKASGSGGVVVEPGVAVDGLGREIVVPERRKMPDPRQPIDGNGEPCGERVDSELMTICLAYAERPDGEREAAPFLRETYTLEVRPGRVELPPRHPAAEAVLAGSAADVEKALCQAAAGETCDPRDQCVPIATVDLRKGKPRVAPCPRPTMASTDVLVDLVVGLVRRVQALERRS